MSSRCVTSTPKTTVRFFLRDWAPPYLAWLLGEPVFGLLGMRRRGPLIDFSAIRRLLIVRLDEIGDIVITTPFLRELRRMFPGVWITLVVNPRVYNLVALCPHVNEVLTYDGKSCRPFPALRRQWRALRLAWRHLWRHRFDLAILPRWDIDYYNGSFLIYLSAAPWRVGYSAQVTDSKRQFNSTLDRLFTNVLEDRSPHHEVEHNLNVIRFLGGTVQTDKLEIWLSPEDEAHTESILESHGVTIHDTIIALSPGAAELKRMWPLANFADLGVWLKEKYHTRIMVVGGPGEEHLGRELRQQIDQTVIDLVGQTTLRQTGAFLKRCSLFIGNDSGPKHLAAAVGIPVIEISSHAQDASQWHRNSPKRFHAWGVPRRVLQPKKGTAPCSGACTSTQAHCILDVTIEQVKEAAAIYLGQNLEGAV